MASPACLGAMYDVLRAKPLARADVPTPGTAEWQAFLRDLLHDAMAIVRMNNTSTRWGALNGAVSLASIPSIEPKGTHLRGAHWHSRSSLLFPKDTGLPFEAFEDGLFKDHTPNEHAYIDAMQHAECLEELVPGLAAIWHMRYQTPWGTANRDFVEMVLTLPLLPHELPYSHFHEQAMLEALDKGAWPSTPEVPRGEPPTLRSFLVVSVPIEHAPTRGYVRAYYAAVEGVREDLLGKRLGEVGVQWLMSTQTDAQGWIPRWVQEWAMPSQIAADVPSFLAWVRAKRA
ncbi:hypothetical protein MCAP1_002122 [Malassezia caprae]|uniref:DUF3074 domain-containing protein n=1 Tax=Malassezia caprae TaxID=1381934 RepID=A0AAF0IWD6_9BASI|nr:hypothetical protein MCAP1_002122 [Malassezia caprae]